MPDIKSSESVSGNISAIQSASNGVSDVNVQKDSTSQFSGNNTLSQLIDQCKNCLDQVKQGTEKYSQTIANAKDAFKETDQNIGKHFMSSGGK